MGRRGKGVISPGAEFYHHRHTGGLCTFSPLPCTWPMRHLYLLIPVEGNTGVGWGVGKGMPKWPRTGVRTLQRQLTHPKFPPIHKILGLRYRYPESSYPRNLLQALSPHTPTTQYTQPRPGCWTGRDRAGQPGAEARKERQHGQPAHPVCSPHPPSSASWLLFPS